MTESAQILLPHLKEIFSKHPKVVDETKTFIASLGNAPMCMLAFINDSYHEKNESMIIQSVSAAIQNMLLMAYEKGIGTCWLAAPNVTGMDKVFKERYAADKGNMVALITFGYPEQEGKMPRRKSERYKII